MISAINCDNTIGLAGLSSDEKPLVWNEKPVANGSVYFEIDTSKRFIFDVDKQEWVEYTSSIPLHWV